MLREALVIMLTFQGHEAFQIYGAVLVFSLVALKGARSQLQQEMTYGGVASSRTRPLTQLVGKFSESKVGPQKIRPVSRFPTTDFGLRPQHPIT